jgi:hypothetical protein
MSLLIKCMDWSMWARLGVGWESELTLHVTLVQRNHDTAGRPGGGPARATRRDFRLGVSASLGWESELTLVTVQRKHVRQMPPLYRAGALVSQHDGSGLASHTS